MSDAINEWKHGKKDFMMKDPKQRLLPTRRNSNSFLLYEWKGQMDYVEKIESVRKEYFLEEERVAAMAKCWKSGTKKEGK